MKGFKTFAFGVFLAVVPAGLQYLAGIDWTQYVSPQVAPVIAGAIVVILRAYTDTAIWRRY